MVAGILTLVAGTGFFFGNVVALAKDSCGDNELSGVEWLFTILGLIAQFVGIVLLLAK